MPHGIGLDEAVELRKKVRSGAPVATKTLPVSCSHHEALGSVIDSVIVYQLQLINSIMMFINKTLSIESAYQ